MDFIERAISSAKQSLENILLKARLWERIIHRPTNERQRRIVSRMLEDDFDGHMNISEYAKMAKRSTSTALRNIQDLKAEKR